jgi:RNA polymerase sigma-70 factor (ECF subfamily)
LSDHDVIRRVLDGEKDKYALLMQKYNRRLYRVCKAYLREETEIEDIMQDTYIKGYEKLSTFEGRSSFGTWITRILINETLQRMRKLNKQTALIDNGESEGMMNLSDDINPERRSVNRELGSFIEKNLEELPENYRVVFLLREVERLSVAETAETLMISETNVKVRLNRAKESLKRSLLETYPIEEIYEFNLIRCGRVAQNVLRAIGVG